MSDLYHIPHDNGKDYRLKKFIEYQHEVPSIDCRFLGEWIKRFNVDKETAVNMIWLHSATYNEITAVFLNEMPIETMEDWYKNKEKLNFGSARKYVKNNDAFVELMDNWKRVTAGRPYEWIMSFVDKEGRPDKTYNNFLNAVCTIKNVGHFAAYRFVDCFVYLKDWFGLNITGSSTLDWKNCANMTSGLYNIFYEDEKANAFDKTHKITENDKIILKGYLLVVKNEIPKVYPEQDNDISIFMGKICSFRNLFKGARYGGFHHDRQLGVIRSYEDNYPQYTDIWKKCYEVRANSFPHKLLGEFGGWNGIRKERKKLWLTTGYTGVEEGI